jgi:hypothetical protein
MISKYLSLLENFLSKNYEVVSMNNGLDASMA